MAMESMFNAVGTMASFMGIIMIVAGVIRFMISFMNEDPDAKGRALMFLLTGVIMISMNSVLGIMSSDIKFPTQEETIDIQEIDI